VLKDYNASLDYKQEIGDLRGDREAMERRKHTEEVGDDDGDEELSDTVSEYFTRTLKNPPSLKDDCDEKKGGDGKSTGI